MSGEYQIVKANGQPGIDGVTGLELLVKEYAAEGWQAQGGPFWDAAGMKWCQAMTRGKQAPAGEVSLREPAQVEQQPGSLRVHADPKDGPMLMRGQPKP